MWQLGFGPSDEEHVTAYRQMPNCRLYLRTSDAQFFYPCVKSCALHPESSSGTCGPPITQFVFLGRRESGSGVPERISVMPTQRE